MIAIPTRRSQLKYTELQQSAAECCRELRMRQRGSALVISLIFLLVITLLVLTSSSGSLMQLRMAGNLRNAQQAQISADTALRGAEWKLWTSANVVGGQLLCTDGSVSSDGCVLHNAKNAAMYGTGGYVTTFRNATGWSNAGVEYKGPGALDYTSASLDTAQLAENPRIIIENLGRVRPPGAGPQSESGAGSGSDGSVNLNSYRITARATGGSKNSIRVLQSTFDAQTSN